MANFYNDVYDKEMKEWFLATIDINQYPFRWWERVFEKSYMFEKIKDKDLCAFTVPEIIEFYKFIDTDSLTSLIVYNTNLIKYAQWALNEDIVFDGQNHFDEINNEILMTCVNITKVQESILTYDRFKLLMSQKIINDQDKFIFYCLFEGIKGVNYQEIVDLKMSDIDEEECKVTLNSGRTMYVSPEFIEICKKADKQTTYLGLTTNEVEIKLIPSVNIYKEKYNSQGKDINRQIYRTINRNINTVMELKDIVSARSIRDSGLIYYLNKRAKKLGVSTEELIYDLDNWQDLIDKYQFNKGYKKRWMLQYKDFLN